jgi:transposase-like protein
MTDTTQLSLIDQLPELVANQADQKSLKKRIRKAIKEAGGTSAITDPGMVIRELTKAVYEALLEEELEQHLGYERHGESPDGNYRNGSSSRTLKTRLGPVDLDIPRDRNGSYEPVAVKKHQRSLGGIDDMVISLYSRGLSTREIEAHLKEIYGVDVSPALVSKITERLTDERKLWQSRPLESLYPILYLDGIRYSVNHDGRVIKKVVYVAIGVSISGKQDVLGLWIAENEGAQFWLSVCNDLKSRGVRDILIACVDGLKGLPEAIQAAFPKSDVQLCVVHMIRAATRFISFKDRKAFCADLKAIYTAPTLEAAELARNQLEEKWESRYPASVRVWRDNWELLVTFFRYPPEIRKFIYTTNQIENLNSVLRKNSAARKVFPNDDSLLKLLYVNVLEQTKKWTHRQGWDTVVNQLAIIFGDRLDDSMFENV